MKINTALILCAGFGKRLNPLTLKTPKPLLKLNNLSMLEHCVNLIIKLGIKNIILNTFHLENEIIKFVKKKNFPIKVKIISDGKKILNTGGGILKMINSSSDDNFLIFNPDTYWSDLYISDIKKMEQFYFSKSLNNILLLTKKIRSYDQDLSGDFELKNHLITNAKKNFIFIGCQILNKSLFTDYKVDNFSISRIWENLILNKKLYGFETDNQFYHLTNLEIFKKLRDF